MQPEKVIKAVRALKSRIEEKDARKKVASEIAGLLEGTESLRRYGRKQHPGFALRGECTSQ